MKYLLKLIFPFLRFGLEAKRRNGNIKLIKSTFSVIFVRCIGEELQDIPTVPDFGFSENKTERDLAMEDCMEEYIQCIIVDR